MANDTADISTAEATRYWESFMAAVRTIITAQDKLEALENDSTIELAERSRFRADRLRLGDELALLNQGHIAFIAGQNAIRPPKKADVERILGLVAAVSELEAQRDTAEAIIDIANKAVAEIQAIHDD